MSLVLDQLVMEYTEDMDNFDMITDDIGASLDLDTGGLTSDTDLLDMIPPADEEDVEVDYDTDLDIDDDIIDNFLGIEGEEEVDIDDIL